MLAHPLLAAHRSLVEALEGVALAVHHSLVKSLEQVSLHMVKVVDHRLAAVDTLEVLAMLLAERQVAEGLLVVEDDLEVLLAEEADHAAHCSAQ